MINDSWEFGVAASDFHIPFQDDKFLDLLIYFLKDNAKMLDYFVINGDFIDFWDVSKFSKVPKTGLDLVDEIAFAYDVLSQIRKAIPNTRIIYVEGNHEFRLRKYIIDNAKALYGMRGLSVEEQLKLDELKIEYVSCLKGFNKFGHNDWKIGELYIGHYDKATKYSVFQLLDVLGVSFIQGHSHHFAIASKSLRDGREIMGVEHGCACSLKPSYINFPNWQHGFSIFYKKVGDNRFQINPIRVVKYKFFWGQKEYNYDDARKVLYGSKI